MLGTWNVLGKAGISQNSLQPRSIKQFSVDKLNGIRNFHTIPNAIENLWRELKVRIAQRQPRKSEGSGEGLYGEGGQNPCCRV